MQLYVFICCHKKIRTSCRNSIQYIYTVFVHSLPHVAGSQTLPPASPSSSQYSGCSIGSGERCQRLLIRHLAECSH